MRSRAQVHGLRSPDSTLHSVALVASRRHALGLPALPRLHRFLLPTRPWPEPRGLSLGGSAAMASRVGVHLARARSISSTTTSVTGAAATAASFWQMNTHVSNGDWR
mmetsp:Transcript_12588/g.38457  ORF Transcript_12588/g.38457 Transcript_12588/m.38457 type:complete len:107 (-) Transcript_12588:634-954(-)